MDLDFILGVVVGISALVILFVTAWQGPYDPPGGGHV